MGTEAQFEDKLEEKFEDKVEDKDEIDQAMDRAIRMLARKPVTRQEVRIALRRKRFSYQVVEHVVTRLTEMGYLNDEDYARDWIQNRIQSNPAGKSRLKQELLRHGIDSDIVDQCLCEAFGDLDEVELAMPVANKLKERLGEVPKEKAFRIVWDRLHARGFSQDTVVAVFGRLGWECTED